MDASSMRCVRDVTGAADDARRPTTHNIFVASHNSSCCSFSMIDILLSLKKSLTFLLPFMPKGVKLSPLCQWRSVSGYCRRSASKQA